LAPVDHSPNRVYLSHSHDFTPPFDSVQRIVPIPRYRLAYWLKLKMGTNTPDSPSKGGNLSFGEKRQKIHTENEIDAEFDVAPFRSSGFDTSMNPTPIAASHNSAKLGPKLQHPAIPLSDDLPQNITTSGGHTCSSSADSSFVFQTLEHSRYKPNPTKAKTCLNNSETNAKPFALNPINLVDSDAIANAFLQYQAEFIELVDPKARCGITLNYGCCCNQAIGIRDGDRHQYPYTGD
jgi:hypothetical protein